jgi:hypothetical protein
MNLADIRAQLVSMLDGARAVTKAVDPTAQAFAMGQTAGPAESVATARHAPLIPRRTSMREATEESHQKAGREVALSGLTNLSDPVSFSCMRTG